MQVSFWIQNDFTWLYGKLSSWTVVSGTRSSFGSFAGCHWWASLAKFSSGRTWNDSNGSMDIVSVRSCFVKFSNLIVSHNISCTDFFLKTVLGSKHFLDSRGDEEKVQKLAQMSFLPSRIKAYLTGSSSRKANQLEYRVWLRSKRWARGFLLNGILTFSTFLTSYRKGFGGKDSLTKHIKKGESSYCWCQNLDVWCNGDTNKR